MSTAVSPGVVRRRILDLGCGSGQTLSKFGWRLVAGDEVVGVDIQLPALHTAHLQYPERSFLTARAELLPFRSASFEAILCHIALPYMDIPAALTEMARVLVPGGSLQLAVHDWRFAIAELRRAWPHPQRIAFRAYVLANGTVFHFTGKTSLPYLHHRIESFQTERGMRRALERSGFTNLTFTRRDFKFLIDARKAPASPNIATCA